MQSVCGVFTNREMASRAMAELMGAGLHPEQISLIASEAARAKLMAVYNDTATPEVKTSGVRIDPFASLLNEAVSVNAIEDPDMNILVAGPLAANLAHEHSNATLVSALATGGIPANEAVVYEDAIRQGKAVLAVHAETDQQTVLAHAVLVDSGALAAAA